MRVKKILLSITPEEVSALIYAVIDALRISKGNKKKKTSLQGSMRIEERRRTWEKLLQKLRENVLED